MDTSSKVPSTETVPSTAPSKDTHKPHKTGVDYSHFEQLDFSSDEDDCHPNIEINTWRRLKERMRKEKGIVKSEPILIDKYNSTKINNKVQGYDLSGNDNEDNTNNEQNINDENIDDKEGKNNVDIDKDSNIIVNDGINNDNNNNDNDNSDIIDSDMKTADNSENVSNGTNGVSSNNNGSSKKKLKNKNKIKNKKESQREKDATEAANSLFEARSNPKVFLDENLDKIRKFCNIKDDARADQYIQKNYDLVHEASEGYLITHAVDRAVEGASKKQLKKYAKRCLQIHNLVQSCQSANVAPKMGVSMFYSKMKYQHVKDQYAVELNKQVSELLLKIEQRRKERIEEAMAAAEDEDIESEKAPLGPGGLDPTEVLNSLPQEMQDAFVSRDVDTLRKVLGSMDVKMAKFHMQQCIDSGLWVENAEDNALLPNDESNNNNDTMESIQETQETQVTNEQQNNEAINGVSSIDELD